MEYDLHTKEDRRLRKRTGDNVDYPFALLILLLFKLLYFTVHFGFSVSPSALGVTAALFAGINLLALAKLYGVSPEELLKSVETKNA